eukprot:29801-Chlamydomonas_euryale.AAC.1
MAHPTLSEVSPSGQPSTARTCGRCCGSAAQSHSAAHCRRAAGTSPHCAARRLRVGGWGLRAASTNRRMRQRGHAALRLHPRTGVGAVKAEPARRETKKAKSTGVGVDASEG